jgi:hypothetical protein
MDSLDRIFKSINESSHMGKKKAKKMGKKNRYDSSSFGMKAEATLSPKQQKIAAIAGNKKKVDAKDLAMLRRKGRKVNASTEIVQVLGLLKEAYEDELISEEAFLAIADPIMRSLSEVTFPDTYEKEDLDDAEAEGPKKVVKGTKKPKVSGTAEERRKRRHAEASDKRSLNPGK